MAGEIFELRLERVFCQKMAVLAARRGQTVPELTREVVRRLTVDRNGKLMLLAIEQHEQAGKPAN